MNLKEILQDADVLMERALAGADLDCPEDANPGPEAGVLELRAFRKAVPLILSLRHLAEDISDDPYLLTPDQWASEARGILNRIKKEE